MGKKKDIEKLAEQWQAKAIELRAGTSTPKTQGELSAYERAWAIATSRKSTGSMRRMLLRAQEFAVAYRNSIKPGNETLASRLDEYRAKCNAFSQIMQDWQNA